MLAVIVGFIFMFFRIFFMRIRWPEAWVKIKLYFYVIYCLFRDFVIHNKAVTFYILFVEIALIVWYAMSTQMYTKFQEGDQGRQMFNEPRTLSKMIAMKVPFKFNTNYAISTWIYLMPQPKEHNANSSIFVNIVDYNNKPKLSYNASLNTLRVTVRLPPNFSNLREEKQKEAQKDASLYNDAYEAALAVGSSEEDAIKAGNQAKTNYTYNNLGDEMLMADIPKIPLQRWHHIVMAYNNGTFDIFLNGVLFRSVPGVFTDMLGSGLTIGSKEGNRGKICNLVFYQGGIDPTKTFTENPIAITGDKVTALYNNFASKNPPVISHIFNIAPTEPSYAQMRINQLIY
jgi:hypothetical protein